jgi:hypothetical protein
MPCAFYEYTKKKPLGRGVPPPVNEEIWFLFFHDHLLPVNHAIYTLEPAEAKMIISNILTLGLPDVFLGGRTMDVCIGCFQNIINLGLGPKPQPGRERSLSSGSVAAYDLPPSPGPRARAASRRPARAGGAPNVALEVQNLRLQIQGLELKIDLVLAHLQGRMPKRLVVRD